MHYSKRSIKVPTLKGVTVSELVIAHDKAVEMDTANVQVPVNHVFACDVSYSMYSDLPKMAKQLKNRIPDIVRPIDTITIMVFSGKDECTILKEMVSINDATALKGLNDAIDRYFKPIGCTCFLDPIENTNSLIAKNKEDLNWSFIFLSDGGHNETPWEYVQTAMKKLSVTKGFTFATIIEYGYRADSEKLSEMAETLGGNKIFADDFNSYEVQFEKILKNQIVQKRVKLDISDVKADMRYQLFVGVDPTTQTVNVYSSANQKEILIPDGTEKLYFLSKVDYGEGTGDNYEAIASLAYVMADRLKYDASEGLLNLLGDKKLYETYVDAYGKQRLMAFQQLLTECIFNKDSRFSNGQLTEASKKSTGNGYCIIDFLEDMMADENYMCLTHEDFNYNRIGVKSVIKQELTDEQKSALAKAKTAHQVQKVQDEIKMGGISVKYKDRNAGYAVKNLTWNEDRANVSVLISIPVTVSLPKNDLGLNEVDTNIWRNYAIIKDGILNVSQIPCYISKKTATKFKKKGLIPSDYTGGDMLAPITIDISGLPLVNRKRVKGVSYDDLASKSVQILTDKFDLKYLGYLKKKFNADAASGQGVSFFINYSQEQIDYLKSLGFTENGFSPKTELDKSGDFYMATALKATVKSFSSIPKIEDIDKKEKAGKNLTPAEQFLKSRMEFIDKLVGDDVDAIQRKFKEVTDSKRTLSDMIAILKFGIIVSHGWFKDKNGYEDSTSEVTLGSIKTQLTLEYKEVKENL
jgi:hypothetical protein